MVGLPSSHLTPEQKRDLWTSWLHVVYQDISGLAYHRRMWHRIRRIVELNEHLNASQAFIDVLVNWYAHSQAMGIRRHVDEDENTRSLVRLLRSIQLHGPLFTLEDLERSYPPELREQASRDYDTWLPEGWIERHLETLQAVADPVRRFANRNVAHLDPRSATATYDDLDRAVDALAEAFLSTSFAITGSSHTFKGLTVASETFDWAQPLRVPWVTPEIEEQLPD